MHAHGDKGNTRGPQQEIMKLTFSQFRDNFIQLSTRKRNLMKFGARLICTGTLFKTAYHAMCVTVHYTSGRKLCHILIDQA